MDGARFDAYKAGEGGEAQFLLPPPSSSDHNAAVNGFYNRLIPYSVYQYHILAIRLGSQPIIILIWWEIQHL